MHGIAGCGKTARPVVTESLALVTESFYSLIPASVSLHSGGRCEIQSIKSGTREITTLTLDGSQLNQTSVQMAAGMSLSVSLGVDRAPAGIYLVRVRVFSDKGNTILKYLIHSPLARLNLTKKIKLLKDSGSISVMRLCT
jgi:hypothetical protein